MTDATLWVGIWDHIDLAQCHIGQAIGKSHCFPHPSLRQAWYLFEV